MNCYRHADALSPDPAERFGSESAINGSVITRFLGKPHGRPKSLFMNPGEGIHTSYLEFEDHVRFSDSHSHPQNLHTRAQSSDPSYGMCRSDSMQYFDGMRLIPLPPWNSRESPLSRARVPWTVMNWNMNEVRNRFRARNRRLKLLSASRNRWPTP